MNKSEVAIWNPTIKEHKKSKIQFSKTMTFACVKPSLTNSTPPSADFSSLCLSTTLIVTLSLFIGEDLFVAGGFDD